MPDDPHLNLTELADLAGVTPRTVRYYIAQGLLPSAGQSGPGPKYDDGHLARLRLIRRLQAEHLPLAEIRRRTSELDEDAINDLAGELPAARPSGSALDYLRAVLGEVSPARDVAPDRPMALRAVAASPPAPPPPASRAGERSQWDRIVLGADIELHIRRPLDRAHNRQVDRLVAIARELLEEDRP